MGRTVLKDHRVYRESVVREEREVILVLKGYQGKTVQQRLYINMNLYQKQRSK